MNRRDPKPKSTAPPSPAEAVLALTVDRITITGLELSPLETQRFEALLIEELRRRLLEQFAVLDNTFNAEALRFDLSEIVLNLDQPSAMQEAVHAIARRLALTLESAARKGVS